MNFKRNIFTVVFTAIISSIIAFNNIANGSNDDSCNNMLLVNPLHVYISNEVHIGPDNFSDTIEDDIKTIESSVVSYSTDEEVITHIVTSKDNLWNLAKNYYGDGNYFYLIMEANQLQSTIIIDGQELIIPNISNIDIKYESTVDTSTVVPVSGTMEYLANFKITGYDPWCKHCCSKTDGITASGVEAVVGRTVACNKIPMGTQIYIEGYGYYTVEDTGGMKGNVIDIACNSHSECYDITNKDGVAVYIIK